MTELLPEIEIAPLRNFICETLLAGEHVNDTDELLISGLLDSLEVMTLVSFIEETFDLYSPFSDVLIENFETINAISGYLQGRLANV